MYSWDGPEVLDLPGRDSKGVEYPVFQALRFPYLDGYLQRREDVHDVRSMNLGDLRTVITGGSDEGSNVPGGGPR